MKLKKVLRNENKVYEELCNCSIEQRPKLEAELEKLLRHHAFAVCWQLLHQHREDLVNFAVFKALRGLPEFRGEAKLSSWFQTIVTNICRKDQSKEILRQEVPLEEASGSTDLSAIEGKIYIEKLLKNLSPKDQRYIQLQLEGASRAEMATEFGITEGGARSFLKLVKERVRKLMEAKQ